MKGEDNKDIWSNGLVVVKEGKGSLVAYCLPCSQLCTTVYNGKNDLDEFGNYGRSLDRMTGIK